MVQSFPLGVAITAVAARDLAKRKRFGAQDPYLTFQLQGRQKYTIVAVKGGVKPEWNQTIKYSQVRGSQSKDETTLTVHCIHEKSGVKVGSSDGLIGSCEIDLKETLYVSKSGVVDGWFQLQFDNKDAGQVHLRLQLCEPSVEEDMPEDAFLHVDHDSRIVKSDSENRADQKIAKIAAVVSNSSTDGDKTSSSSTGLPNGGVQRTSTRLGRPRSMADLKERQLTVRFQEPAQRKLGSKSMEEVRDSIEQHTDGDENGRNEIGSPKQTFTLQDRDGNINPLNLLIAPFDPNWLEPTPLILHRALSAHSYYDDLRTQMSTNPRELFPRVNSYQNQVGYPSEGAYMINGQQTFQNFNQMQPPTQTSVQAPIRPPQPTGGPISVHSHLPQQFQPQLHQQLQQPNPAVLPAMSMPMPMPQPQTHHMANHPQPPAPAQQTLPSQTINAVAYQPQSAFDSRQPSRSRMDMAGNKKYMSLPSRTHMSPSQLQQLREADSVQGSMTLPSGTSTAVADAVSHSGGSNIQTSLPSVSALGPAAGYLPDTYSPEHQRTLSNQLHQSMQPGTQSSMQPALGSTASRMQRSLPEHDRPGTSFAFYPTQPSSTQPSAPNIIQGSNGYQPMLFTSPVQQQQQQLSSDSYSRLNNSFSGGEAFNTMQKSSVIPIPGKIPLRAREAIFSQYAPHPVAWEGKDIQDSLPDPHLGRRILSRYALGIGRESFVREGFYAKDRSPFVPDDKSTQQRQFQQQQQPRSTSQRQLQRQFTIDQDGNDRVILKYLKSKRDWEIDCVMMRYLTCQRPEEKLQSQYLDYPQPQQHCQFVNPFVVGLYETFLHPHGADDGSCRYLSVLQWYPETLQGYIEDRTVSGEGLELTLPIARSLIECVEWIHNRKICHLNIKPTNFVRDPYMASFLDLRRGVGWKLVDFESARVTGEEYVGRCTFSYAAPEILDGHSSSKGTIAKCALDIWSLGLVIYELLTDQPLFRTDAQAKEVFMKNARAMKPVRYYDSKNIDPEYHLLLDAMLAHDPEKRLSASQLLQMDIFTLPIKSQPVSQDRLLRNNSILSLCDLKATRLCSLKSDEYTSDANRGDKEEIDDVPESGDPGYESSSSHQTMMLEGIGRILDSPFEQIPRLFMLLPPMNRDLDPARPFLPSNLFQNKSLRLVLLCEGLNGYGEDAHVTEHRGYLLHDTSAFVQDVGKLLLHLVSVAGTNNPGYETPAKEQPLTLTGTPLDNCQRWYPSLRSYYEILQSALQRKVGPAPSLNEVQSLREPTLKALEQWLVRLVRKQCQTASTENLNRKQSSAALFGSSEGAGGSDELVDQLAGMLFQERDLPEVTGPGGGEGYGGLYKMPVGNCGDRWICRGCISKQMAIATAAKAKGSTK
ncbi:hypothetical protein BGZ98_004099 [Dissophora globulifera]|nr:hypothetical protein BGZ98_004099 [Dissophora globulifera]